MESYPTPRNPQIQNARPDPGTGGFLISDADLQRSQAAVELDTKGFALAAGAGAAIGQGMQGLGEGLGQIAAAQFASINRKKVTEFDAKLDAASDAVAQKMAGEPDELKWPEIFHKEAEAWNKEFSKDTTLSPAARDAITDKFSAWKITSESSIKRASFDRSLQNEVKAGMGAHERAVYSKDWEKAAEERGKLVQSGAIRDDVAARLEIREAEAKKEAVREAGEAEKTRFRGVLAEAPFAAKDALDAGKFNFTDPTDLLNARTEADRAMRYKQAEQLDILSDKIVTGEATDEYIDEFVGILRLGPTEAKKWKNFRAGLAQERASGKPFDADEAVKLNADIEAYDAEKFKTPEDALAAFSALAIRKSLMGAYGGETGRYTEGVLGRKLSQRHPLEDHRTAAAEKDKTRTLHQLMDAYEKAGDFGSEQVKLTRTVIKDGEEVEESYFALSPEAMRQSIRVRKYIEPLFLKAVQAGELNPDDFDAVDAWARQKTSLLKSTAKVKEEIGSGPESPILPMPGADPTAALDRILGSAGVAVEPPAASYQSDGRMGPGGVPEPDLPDKPGSTADNSLLGATPPAYRQLEKADLARLKKRGGTVKLMVGNNPTDAPVGSLKIGDTILDEQ